MNIKEQRQLLQDLLDEGKLDSLSVQVIALNLFANSIGYKAVNGDIRKGFMDVGNRNDFVLPESLTLQGMQSCYNNGYINIRASMLKIPRVTGDKIVERISLQYSKRTSKQLTTQLYWLKFIKEN